MMRATSLRVRLLAASAVWIVLSLALAGALLVVLFRDHVERRFEAALGDHMEELIAASEIGADGRPLLSWQPSDPRFNRPYSGWYWQIGAGAQARRSDSLWQATLPVSVPTGEERRAVVAIDGPDGRALRALVRAITLPRGDDPILYAIAGPEDDIDADVRRFALRLALTLVCLALALIGAAGLQVRYGLRPLADLQRALRDIRAGRARRLPDSTPGEVRPVVLELNALLDHSRNLIERARTQAGNLAHSIRTPLTVIGNEAHEVPGERGRVLRDAAADVRRSVDRHLSRARAAGAADILGARTALAPAVADIVEVMERLHRDRHLRISTEVGVGLWVRGDPGDLEEMVGNLIDNACKWARSTVAISAVQVGDTIHLAVEDDGPGIEPQRRADVIARGRRLDESRPGAGLGLDIVADLVALNRGRLHLGTAAAGGLRAELELPAAEVAEP